MQTTCAHCHTEYDLGDGHECTPNCLHCGVTYKDLHEPEYDSKKIAVSRHQRECEERPKSWDKPISDPEGQFREERRERERIRQWEEKQRKRNHVWREPTTTPTFGMSAKIAGTLSLSIGRARTERWLTAKWIATHQKVMTGRLSMSDHSMPETLVEKHGPFCAYCGLPFDSHPVEYSRYNDKSGVFCEEPKERNK